MIDLGKYLAVFPGANASELFCDTELHDILLNSMTNIWNRKKYV